MVCNIVVVVCSYDIELVMCYVDILWVVGYDIDVVIGVLEDLVCNGVFEVVFCIEGIIFDFCIFIFW